MNIAVVCLGKSHQIKTLADDLAREVRIYMRYPFEFSSEEHADLLLIGFDTRFFNKKREREVFSFLSRINREHIHNVALFSVYSHSNTMMKHVVSYCQKQDLPLLRDFYSAHISFHKELSDIVLQNGRVYVTDMMNIVNNYY